MHTVSIPKKSDVQVFGDYILVTAECESCGHSNFFAISWKTGTATEVSGAFESFQCRPNFEQSSIALSSVWSAESSSHRPGQESDCPDKERKQRHEQYTYLQASVRICGPIPEHPVLPRVTG